MQILGRIYGGIVNPDLVVQVRAGAVSRRTDVAKDIPTTDILSFSDREPGEVSVNGLDAVAVVDHHLAPVPVAHPSLQDRAVRRRTNRLAFAGRDINSGVECAFAIKGIQPRAEGAGYDPLHRPFGWGVRHIDDAAESRRKTVREVEPM